MEYLYNFVFSSGEYCECDPSTSGCDYTIDNCGYDYGYGTAYFDIFVKQCESTEPTTVCEDVEPPKFWRNNSCAKQKAAGKCSKRIELNDGYCRKTCGICS